ncbi:MAG: mannonate dehydratase [Olsenella sp.]|nr:mannonate dehydratase [Olsenella sp.]
MKMTFRWYGEGADSVTLQDIRQIPGVSGIMGTLPGKPAGEVWTLEECRSYIDHVHEASLECEVIESVNVHEDIKLGLPSRDAYIENYRTTIRNLASCGVKVIVYNFMPVLDYMRTEHFHSLPDGSTCLYYDEAELEGRSPRQIVEDTLKEARGWPLAGWEPERLSLLEDTLARYEGVTEDDVRENLRYFLDGIIPTCEEAGVKMACHPDDPGWKIFGLPRIAHSQEDYDKLLALRDSPCNTVCLCTGSLGSNPENDIPEMIRHFGAMDRIGCMHVRNVKYLGPKKFRESAHLSSAGSLDMFEIMKAVRDSCPDTYVRPDHGRMIWGEDARPGYGLYDRALGCEYLLGLWEALGREKDAR